jgi:hypothetical protein
MNNRGIHGEHGNLLIFLFSCLSVVRFPFSAARVAFFINKTPSGNRPTLQEAPSGLLQLFYCLFYGLFKNYFSGFIAFIDKISQAFLFNIFKITQNDQPSLII